MFLIILIIIVATLGNALVLAATWMAFHQPSKYFIACVAVTDLLIGVLFFPFHLYNNVHEAAWYYLYTSLSILHLD
jgi:hypothetical protein